MENRKNNGSKPTKMFKSHTLNHTYTPSATSSNENDIFKKFAKESTNNPQTNTSLKTIREAYSNKHSLY